MIQNHIIIFVNYERSLLTFFTRITGKGASSEMMVLSMFHLIYSLFVQLKYMMRYFLIILHGWFKQLEYIVSFLISTISCTYLKSCLILVSNQMFCHYIFLSSHCIAAYCFYGIGAILVSYWSYLALLENNKDYLALSYH